MILVIPNISCRLGVRSAVRLEGCSENEIHFELFKDTKT